MKNIDQKSKKIIYYKKIYWILFIIISLALFIGYIYLEEIQGEELEPFLNGLGLVEHFAAHYTFAILVGLLILFVYLSYRKIRLNEPLILTVVVIFSHLPDIRSWYLGVFTHEPWEIIFLLHPIVDEFPILIFFYILSDTIMIFAYCELVKSKKLKV